MLVPYLKMEGAGNRIVVVDQRAGERSPPSSERLRELGNAATGPGFDQLMWVGPATGAGSHASYRVFNADGSEVEQCGNGVRCVAWMLARDDAAAEFRLDSPAGRVTARMRDDGLIAVDMGAPEFEPARIPFDAPAAAERYELDVGGMTLSVAVVSMGNPHCVLDVDAVSTADVAGLGPAIEHHPRFPAHANVGFRTVRDRSTIDLRVHERGVGETRACGTGACAAMATARESGLVDDEVTVQLPGGQLVVSWRGGTAPVWLTGNAELLSEGTIDL